MEWSHIPGTKYSVSSDGRVRNDSTGAVLSQTANTNGYMRVFLCCEGKQRTAYVHRLVAEAFIENPLHKVEVNHIDGDKTNNSADNLEWCTHSENQKHRFHVLGKTHTKEKMAKITQLAAQANRRHVVCCETGDVYQSISAASKATGINRGNISNCVCGRYKTAGGYHWKYLEV